MESASSSTIKKTNEADNAVEPEKSQDKEPEIPYFEESDDEDDGINIYISDLSNRNTIYPTAHPGARSNFRSNKNQNEVAPAFRINPASKVSAIPTIIKSVNEPNINGVNIYEYDLDNHDKPWLKPGADITDYFNYGFNEQTWKAYCERQKTLRLEAAQLAKTSDLSSLFSILPNIEPSSALASYLKKYSLGFKMLENYDNDMDISSKNIEKVSHELKLSPEIVQLFTSLISKKMSIPNVNCVGEPLEKQLNINSKELTSKLFEYTSNMINSGYLLEKLKSESSEHNSNTAVEETSRKRKVHDKKDIKPAYKSRSKYKSSSESSGYRNEKRKSRSKHSPDRLKSSSRRKSRSPRRSRVKSRSKSPRKRTSGNRKSSRRRRSVSS